MRLFAILLILLAAAPVVLADTDELAVERCNDAACSVAELNSYNNISGMTVSRGGGSQRHTNMTAFPESAASTINGVTAFFSHSGDAGISGSWTVDFRNKTDGTSWCTATPAHQGTWTQDVLNPAGCGWTGGRLKQLQILFTNNDGGPPSDAYIDFINISVDYTPATPINSLVRYTYVNRSFATIEWVSDGPANSTVEYGLTQNLGTTVQENAEVTSHAINVTGLEENTFYYYNVSSCNTEGCTTSGPYNFTTYQTLEVESCSGLTCSAPEVRDYNQVIGAEYDQNTLYVANIGSLGYQNATINEVIYRTSYEADTTATVNFINRTSGTVHCTITAATTTGTEYFEYTPAGCGWQAGMLEDLAITHDRDGGGGNNLVDFSAILVNFILEPQIQNVTAENITFTSANITWRTNNSANSTVEYGTTTALGSQTSDSSSVREHAVLLTGLNHNTTYFYNVTSCTADTCETQGPFSFTTLEDLQAPKILNLQNSTTRFSATITWDTNEDANETVEYGLTTSLGTRIENATYALVHSVVISGLSSNQTYYYNVTACDRFGNCNETGPFNFTTQPLTQPVAPTISNIQSLPTDIDARITWETDIGSNSTVYWGLTTSLGSNASQSGSRTQHSVLLSGLSNETRYYYKVQSCNNVGCTNSSIAHFDTLVMGGYCRLRYTQKGDDFQQGRLGKGDIAILDCQLPTGLGHSEEFIVRLSWGAGDIVKTSTTPRLLYKREAIFP